MIEDIGKAWKVDRPILPRAGGLTGRWFQPTPMPTEFFWTQVRLRHRSLHGCFANGLCGCVALVRFTAGAAHGGLAGGGAAACPAGRVAVAERPVECGAGGGRTHQPSLAVAAVAAAVTAQLLGLWPPGYIVDPCQLGKQDMDYFQGAVEDMDRQALRDAVLVVSARCP
ncbi:hypothetical protein [Stenotrophomonas cyclobalanopsidis]|uniref:hypothetical protein n=1 Tax=Stenotrophomonas cyclobalanopsidis TaxID=2771362 RepID=UPI00346019BB